MDERLGLLGRDRGWLAEATGYSASSLRDALAPASRNGLSARMAARIEEVLAEAERAAAHYSGQFTEEEQAAIRAHAEAAGAPSADAWIVGLVRAVLKIFSGGK